MTSATDGSGVESSPPAQEFFDELRRRRAELLDSLGALEQALAAPAPAGQTHWAERVHVALVEISADFGAHIDITEGPDALYDDLLTAAPRLAGPVARLTSEHAVINGLINEALDATSDLERADAEHVRELGTALLATLVRHRQRGSDLVYEAYNIEIGGET